MKMKITELAVEHLSVGFIDGERNEGLRHVKSLPYLSVVQATEGSYDITLGEGAEENTGEGGAFIAPSGVRQTITHRVSQKSGLMSARWVFLYAAVNGRYPLDLAFAFPMLFPSEKLPELNGAMEEIFSAQDVCDRMCGAYRLIKLLLSFAEERRTKRMDEVSAAISYMEKNYREHITVERLAQESLMSESKLYAAFREATGRSPIAYLNDHRLAMASLLLKRTDKPIWQIAAEVGIEDALYFSRIFAKKYMVPPREYRKNESIKLGE